MKFSSIHEELFDAEGMQRALDALSKHYQFLFHRAPIKKLDEIRNHGLRAFEQPLAKDVDLNLFEKLMGERPRKILCLKPSVTNLVVQNDGLARVTLACSTSAVSCPIGLDWSYSSCWPLAEILRDAAPSRSSEDIFLEVVRRRGSVVTYCGVPASSIRIRLNSSSSDASQWPALADTTELDQFYLREV